MPIPHPHKCRCPFGTVIMARSEISDNEIALYEVLHHPAEFIEFMTPVDERATRRLPLQTWFDEDHFGSVRPYQLPGLPWDHMLPDDKYPIDASKAPGYRGVDRVGVGNGLIFGGRKTSKSFENGYIISRFRFPGFYLIVNRDDCDYNLKGNCSACEEITPSNSRAT